MAKQVLTLNQISLKGLDRLPRDRYEIASEFTKPDAILLRSFKLQEDDIPPSVLAIARAGGAGTVRPLGGLELDDAGAETGQQPPAVRPSPDLTEVEHDQV